jgi:hypothetical protein
MDIDMNGEHNKEMTKIEHLSLCAKGIHECEFYNEISTLRETWKSLYPKCIHCGFIDKSIKFYDVYPNKLMVTWS